MTMRQAIQNLMTSRQLGTVAISSDPRMSCAKLRWPMNMEEIAQEAQ